MGFTRRELIQFLDGLVELASEENKVKAVLAKEKFLSNFEKTYGYEKEVITEVSKLPPHYIAAMPDSVQEEIRQKVIAALTEHGECTPENVDRAMSSKIYDLEDLIDIREYTAASEVKYCYDNNLLVNYDEMQPGDLIFYSYDKNGRFMNITHVAIYVGNGKVVEAANARLMPKI